MPLPANPAHARFFWDEPAFSALHRAREDVRGTRGGGLPRRHDPGELPTRRPVRARVYGPLDGDHPELARAENVLIEKNFEKGRVAAALPIHRNTLRERTARISEITGVDLERSERRGLAWLAWLEGGDWTSGHRGEGDR